MTGAHSHIERGRSRALFAGGGASCEAWAQKEQAGCSRLEPQENEQRSQNISPPAKPGSMQPWQPSGRAGRAGGPDPEQMGSPTLQGAPCISKILHISELPWSADNGFLGGIIFLSPQDPPRPLRPFAALLASYIRA